MSSADLVVLFLPSLAGGGAERCTINPAGALGSADTRVQLVVGTGQGQLAHLVPPHVEVIDLHANRVATAVVPLARHLRRARPRVTLSSLPHANLAMVVARGLARSDTRVVLWEHNMLSRVAEERTVNRDRLLPGLARLLYPRADGIVAVSHPVADDLERLTGMHPHVLPNPVLDGSLHDRASEPVDDPWLPAAVPTAVAIGRLSAQKDFATLLRAFALVRRDRQARLIILGEGPERQPLEGLIRHLGVDQDVRLPGYVANPYPYLARADLVVSSSRYEGLPTVLIEAVALGRPIVATDCLSGPREILAGGRHGRLVAVADVGELAGAIHDGLDGAIPRPRRDAVDRYQVDRAASEFADLLGVDR